MSDQSFEWPPLFVPHGARLVGPDDPRHSTVLPQLCSGSTNVADLQVETSGMVFRRLLESGGHRFRRQIITHRLLGNGDLVEAYVVADHVLKSPTDRVVRMTLVSNSAGLAIDPASVIDKVTAGYLADIQTLLVAKSGWDRHS